MAQKTGITKQLAAAGKSPAPDEMDRAARQRRQEHVSCLVQKFMNDDPQWPTLAEYIRKTCGEAVTLTTAETLYLVFGRPHPSALCFPFTITWTVEELLAILCPHSPKGARRLLDAMLDDRKERRTRSKETAERNATWKRWHDEEKLGPRKIARRWLKETGQKVAPGTVKQALYRERLRN